jgi:hypothetical protein
VPSRLPVAASITYEPSMRKVVPALSRAPYEMKVFSEPETTSPVAAV